MGFFADFRKFLMKGDIIALATAVVIGAAFNKIISSVVSDIIMPVIGVITGVTDFSQNFLSLDGEHYETLEAARAAEAAVLTYGNLIDKERSPCISCPKGTLAGRIAYRDQG